jgi:hypothetical protein
MKRSILQNILEQVKSLDWQTKGQEKKAVQLITNVFNHFTSQKKDFTHYAELSSVWFGQILSSTRDIEIKKKLIESGILEEDTSYNVKRGIAKGYRLHKNLFSLDSISFSTVDYKSLPNTDNTNEDSKKRQTSIPSIPSISYICSAVFSSYENHVLSVLNKLEWSEDVFDYIPNISCLKEEDVNINLLINSSYGMINTPKKSFGCSKEYALGLAQEKGLDLIEYGKQWYIERLSDFLSRKSAERAILFSQQVYNLKNKVLFATRNETNRRLDHNLTSMKSELLDKLRLDGERLLELDIANSQFAMAANLNKELDHFFIEYATSGQLYEKVSQMFGISREDAKELIVQKVAFGMNGRVKKMPQYAKLKRIWPLFVKWMENIKEKEGYKNFAVLLQLEESRIVIDGCLKYLINEGHDVLTVHDSFRIKESEFLLVKSKVEKYFQSIGFKCMLRHKVKITSKKI